jgi:hypothetical protein
VLRDAFDARIVPRASEAITPTQTQPVGDIVDALTRYYCVVLLPIFIRMERRLRPSTGTRKRRKAAHAVANEEYTPFLNGNIADADYSVYRCLVAHQERAGYECDTVLCNGQVAKVSFPIHTQTHTHTLHTDEPTHEYVVYTTVPFPACRHFGFVSHVSCWTCAQLWRTALQREPTTTIISVVTTCLYGRVSPAILGPWCCLFPGCLFSQMLRPLRY